MSIASPPITHTATTLMATGTAANSTMTSSTTLASHPTKESGSPSIAASTHSHDSGVTKEKAAPVVVGGKDKNAPKSAPPKGVSGGMQAPLELPRWRFWLVFVSLMVAIFLFALGECGCHGSIVHRTSPTVDLS